MQRTFGTVVLVTLVVLAGCSGVFGGSGQPAETVTPAAVPTDEPTPTPVPQLAPGVTGEGIENASALIDAHGSFFRNRSFTQKSNSTALAANGSTVLRTTSTLRTGPPGEGLYSVIVRNGSYPVQELTALPARSEGWFDEQRYVVKRTFRNGTTTYSRQSTSATRSTIASGTLPYLLESFDTNSSTVTERFTRNGATLYRVRGVTRANTAGNMTLRLLVDSRGVVRNYTTIRRLPSSMNVSKSITKTRFAAIGATDAPERPLWVDTAMNRTTATRRTETARSGG